MKEKITAFFNKVSPWFDKLGTNPYLQTISGAMMSTLGPVFIGSISVLLIVLLNFIPGMKELTAFTEILSKVNQMTIGSLAIYITILMGYHLVRKLDNKEDPVSAGVISLMSFLIITPSGQMIDKTAGIPFTWLGSQGIFSAMIVGLVSASLYLRIKKKGWTIKMPAGVPPMVTRMFEALIPAILIGILFIFISFLFNMTSFGSMHQFVYSIIQQPLKGIGGSIGAMIFLSLLQQILWFFGIHGTNVIMPLVTPLWMAMDVENLNAVQAGQVPPNIVGLAFFSIMTFGGLALGLVVLMLRAKSKQFREVGKISILPALFGITEPVIFGMPLVLNFNLAIPFITNNTIALILAYFLTKMGLVARFIGVQSIFGLPVGLHAAVEGSLSVIILQLFIQFILSPLLWYPWFKHLDNITYQLEQEAAKLEGQS
ncbi:PTS sugar transporter subunit IIC [Enterococcus rivorum]|uniref:Permease IIC component n=1 Tax=Enterococcus rivorum TaxID=762845 RepID=A0A1E5KZ01_9ENTE|nr:PTS transporter subunit EIIC [Enterococcus rivorum]MBP2097574.1 PTS system cellobiose-specific IIC component [Enterococcus rivorum]OEH83024.1 PTS sugar transporter [Enterococcus rivorum]